MDFYLLYFPRRKIGCFLLKKILPMKQFIRSPRDGIKHGSRYNFHFERRGHNKMFFLQKSIN